MAFPVIPVLGAVSSAIGALSSVGRTPKKDPGTLGKDDFLKLLVAQLKSQNPLNPLDNTQFVAQSAQFSSLEELQNIRESLDTMAGASGGSALAAGTSLLGRPVTASAASFTYAGATVTLPFTLAQPVANAQLEVVDGDGTVVSTVALGPRSAGAQTATFQPAPGGPVLPAGQYTYRIASLDASGRRTPLPAISGTVTGIVLEHGIPTLVLGNRKVLMSDVAGVAAAGS
jgi:flagellar basal-body rod modification protein FlgD